MQDHLAMASIARRQYGILTSKQLRSCGYTPSAQQRLVSSGRLESLHAGVYRLASAARSPRQHELAAVLAAGPGAALSHRSGAASWDMGDHRDIVEVTVPRGRLPRLRGVVVHRSRDLTADWVTLRRGIPTTNPLRTILDLGAVVDDRRLEDALDLGLAGRLFSVAAVEWAYNELHRPGRDGCGRLRRVLDQRALADDPPDGLLEPRMARLLRDHRLPPVEFQYDIRDGRGRFLGRVDFAYPAARLVIEVDGYRQRRTAASMEHDLERQNDIVNAAWRVLRFTWHMVVRRPSYVAAQIAAALGTHLAAQRPNPCPKRSGELGRALRDRGLGRAAG